MFDSNMLQETADLPKAVLNCPLGQQACQSDEVLAQTSLQRR